MFFLWFHCSLLHYLPISVLWGLHCFSTQYRVLLICKTSQKVLQQNQSRARTFNKILDLRGQLLFLLQHGSYFHSFGHHWYWWYLFNKLLKSTVRTWQLHKNQIWQVKHKRYIGSTLQCKSPGQLFRKKATGERLNDCPNAHTDLPFLVHLLPTAPFPCIEHTQFNYTVRDYYQHFSWFR